MLLCWIKRFAKSNEIPFAKSNKIPFAKSNKIPLIMQDASIIMNKTLTLDEEFHKCQVKLKYK